LSFITIFTLFSQTSAADSILFFKKSHLNIASELSLSFPQPLQVGFELTRTPGARWKIFGDTGIFALPLHSKDKSFKMFSFQGGVRYLPLRNRLFSVIGVGFRQASFSTNTSAFRIDDEVLATDGSITLRTLFIRLGIGVVFRLGEKLMFGMDAGYQFALLGGASLVFANSQTQQNSSSSGLLAVRSESLVRIARLGVSQITLMRLSYFMD
jgi:hypothetical protein